VNYHSITSDFHGKGRTGKNLGRVVNDCCSSYASPARPGAAPTAMSGRRSTAVRATPRKPQLYGQDALISPAYGARAPTEAVAAASARGESGSRAGVTRDRPIDGRGFTDAMRRAVLSKRKTTFFEL
jgi:hypothetical protein